MTIASFCHQLLLERGALTTQQLAEAASAAGVTSSTNPEQAVRNAVRNRAASLPGDRWTASLTLLEGRWLTTRTFSEYDLSLLLPACRQAPVPLAQGGFVRAASYGDRLVFPPAFLDRRGLVGLQVRDGVLHAEDLDDSPELGARGCGLAERLPGEASHGYDFLRKENARLWAALEQDGALLRGPTAPLSECLPAFADLVRREGEMFAFSSPWTTAIELPSSVMREVESAPRRAGLPVDSWVVQLVERELGLAGDAALPFRDNVISFPSRLPSPAPRRRTP